MSDHLPLPRRNRLRPFVWGGLAALLLLPLIAMQFTREVAWDETDFLVMGVLLALVGGGYELTIRLSDNLAYRLGAAVAIVTSFLLIWSNLAVGFIGNEDNPWNLLFGGVLLTMIVGAGFARFRAAGLRVVLALTAAAQAAVCIAAFLAGENVPPGPAIVFTGLWLLSASLFHTAMPRRS